MSVCVCDRQTDRRTVTTAVQSVGYRRPCPLHHCHFCRAGYIDCCWLLCWLLVTMFTTDLWLVVVLLAVMFSNGCSVYWRSFWLLWLPCSCSYSRLLWYSCFQRTRLAPWCHFWQNKISTLQLVTIVVLTNVATGTTITATRISSRSLPACLHSRCATVALHPRHLMLD